MTTPEKLSFDGRSVIRSDEYRTAAAELNRYQTAEQIAYYGNLFASAPALYAALEGCVHKLEHSANLFEQSQGEYAGGAARQNRSLVSDLRKQAKEARAALALARGEEGGEVK